MAGSIPGTGSRKANSISGVSHILGEVNSVVYEKGDLLNISNASSLFITDPSTSPQFAAEDLEFDNSSGSEHNLSSVDSLAADPPLQNNSSTKISGHSSFASQPPTANGDSPDDTDFQDSSFINSTRGQFDLDINIDGNKVPQRNHKVSPWKKATTEPAKSTSLLTPREVAGTLAETLQTKKLEETTKQLTNCKIQLKLYERFLQDLIDKHQIDAGELSGLNTQLLAKSISRLEQEHADMCTLVEDLYASVEEFQSKWRDADKRMMDLDHTIHEIAFEVSDLLARIDGHVDADPGDAPQVFLETALPFLRDKIASLDKNSDDEHTKTILDLQQEHETLQSGNVNAEKMLRAQLQEIAQWKNDYTQLKEKYDLIQSKADPEFQRLRNENDRLLSLNKVVDDKLHEYQVMISQLQREVNEFKDLSRKGSLSDVSDTSSYTSLREREKYLLLQRDFDNLQRLHDDMVNEFDRFKETSASTIASLTNQLNNRKRDLISLRAEHTALDNIQHDLETALEKQRVLTAEKMKLMWQVDTLTKDKAALQGSLDRMTEKLGDNDERKTKKLLKTREQLDNLFKLDVWEFQRLFESFNKIADDSSLESPKQKIDVLVQAVSENSLEDDFSSLKDYHKSVFDYFARAVETIVNDHIRLLLKESESVEDDKVHKLEKKIITLEKQLLEQTPGSRLRIEELTNRWKVEREARVHDNEQAKKRLQQLEEENERLRHQ